MRRLTGSDLAAAVEFLGDASTVDGTTPFTTELLDRLLELVPCEFATYQELDRVTGTVFSYVPCSAEGTTPHSNVPRVLSAAERDAIDQSITLAERRRRGQFHGAMTWSDLVGRGRRLRYDVNGGYQREWGVVDHACLTFNSSDVRWVWLTLESTGRRDFSDRDRRVLELLEPHLAARVRDARHRRELTALRASLGSIGDDQAIALIDPDGQLGFASPAAERLLGAYFGEVNGRVPGSITSWARRRNGSDFTLSRGDRRLIVRAVGDGAYVLSEHPRVALSPRELDVMRCVAAGKSNPEIARILWVAPGTVRKHLDNVYEKLGVHSRTAALAALGMTSEPR
jgi:DNA-binding CsgD family transcriptional regulator/PAS domain-containing protein